MIKYIYNDNGCLSGAGFVVLRSKGQRWMLETKSEGAQYFAGQVDVFTCSCTTVVEYFDNRNGCLIGEGFVFLRSKGQRWMLETRSEGAQCFAGPVDGCHLLLYSSSEEPLSFTTIIKMDA